MPNRIVKGDIAIVTTGRDKGKQGVVMKVLPAKQRVIVEGVNIIKKHVKASQAGQPAGILEKEAPVHLSNVMLVDPVDGRPTRVGFEQTDSGDWKRFSRRSKAEIPFPPTK